MATKLTKKSTTPKILSGTLNSRTRIQAEGASGRRRSSKSAGVSAGGTSPKRVQLEIFSQSPPSTDLMAADLKSAAPITPVVDSVRQEPQESQEPQDAPRFWSGATRAWQRVESARARGKATVIPDSGNLCQVSGGISEESNEAAWKDSLWLAAGVLSLAVMFFTGV